MKNESDAEVLGLKRGLNNARVVSYAVVASIFLLQGCGGYGHMHGDEVAKLVLADLSRYGLCSTTADCLNRRLVTTGMGIDSLHLNVNADITIDQIADVVSHIIRKAPPGKIQVKFFDRSGEKKLSIDIDGGEVK